jgi:rod shape-determining protein MreD
MPSSVARVVLAAALLLVAVVVQVTVLARLPLPGATPDLVLVVVASWALKRGPLSGAAIGFAAGLLRDLAPPMDGTLGLGALVLALVGYAVGLAADDAARSAVAPLVIVVVASVLALLLWAGLAVLLGDERVTGSALAPQLFAQALYTAVLTPFVLPVVHRLIALTEPAPTRW